jgi:uncharacterized protein (DUF1015 family)
MSEQLFTPEEIDVLFNALELWENESLEAGDVARAVMANFFRGENTDIEEKMRTVELESRTAKRMRKEQSAYLKVKLLQLRDKQVVRDAMADVFKDVVQKETGDAFVDGLIGPTDRAEFDRIKKDLEEGSGNS